MVLTALQTALLLDEVTVAYKDYCRRYIWSDCDMTARHDHWTRQVQASESPGHVFFFFNTLCLHPLRDGGLYYSLDRVCPGAIETVWRRLWLATRKGRAGEELQVHPKLISAIGTFEPGLLTSLTKADRLSCDVSRVPNTLHEGIKQLRVAVSGSGGGLHILVAEERSWNTELVEAGTVMPTKAEVRPQELTLLLVLRSRRTIMEKATLLVMHRSAHFHIAAYNQ